MKVRVNRRKLREAVDLAQGVVDPKNIKPVLQDICFTLDSERLRLTATNLELGLSALIKEGVETEREGSIALPAGEISSIVRESPDEKLDLEAEDQFCWIRGSDSEYRIAGDDPGDFPGIAPPPEDQPLEVESGVLAEMIRKTRFAAASEAMRYALNGALVVGKAGEKAFEMVGADGRRLARIRRNTTSETPADMRGIISLRGLALMERIVSDVEGSVKLRFGERQTWLQTDDLLLVAQLVEGHYPNYEEVIPDNCDKRAVIDRGALLSAVRRASVVVTEESHAVNLAFESGAVVVSSDTPERGSARVRVEAKYEEEPVTIRFNPDYIIDMLKVAEEDDIIVELKEPFRPAILRSGRNYQYLIMPITEGQG